MKKLPKLLAFCFTFAVACCSLTACGTYKGEISNNNIAEYEAGDLAFFTNKNASYGNTLISALNEAIAELGQEKISELISYHNDLIDGKSATLSFDLPNLSDNTNGTLVVYSSVDGPPFDYLGKNNEVMGMEIDIIKFAAEKLNKKIETRTCVFGSLTLMITQESNEWRMSGVGVRITAERQESVRFCAPYWKMKLNIISKAEDNFSSITQLNNKKIGVYNGESGEIYVNDKVADGTLSAKTKVVTYTTPQTAFQAFLTGKVDAVVCLDYVADGLIKNR